MNFYESGWNSSLEHSFEEYYQNGFIPGRVIFGGKQSYRLITPDGEYKAILSESLRFHMINSGEMPAVGDFVVINKPDVVLNAADVLLRIQAILPRKTVLSRKATISGGRKTCPTGVTGGSTDQQVVAANIDTIFFVVGLDEDFNLRKIERYITQGWESGAFPVLLLNKADICDNVAEKEKLVRQLSQEIPVISISAGQNQGIEVVYQYLEKGQTGVLLGSSGVGKSTLINALLHSAVQRVNVVKTSDGKGKHTTTNRELFFLKNESLLIDTPGLKQFQLWAEESTIDKTFADLIELMHECRYRNCTHTAEPGCAVLKAIESGELDAGRLRSYYSQKAEANALSRKINQRIDREGIKLQKKKIARSRREYKQLIKKSVPINK